MNYDINVPDHVVNYPVDNGKLNPTDRENDSSIFPDQTYKDPNIPTFVVDSVPVNLSNYSYIGNYNGLLWTTCFSPLDNPSLDELTREKNINDLNAQTMRQYIIDILNADYNDAELKSLGQNYSVSVSDLEESMLSDKSIPEDLKNEYFENLSALENADSLKIDAIKAKMQVADKEKYIEELKAKLDRLNLRLSTIPEDEKEAYPKDREMQKHIKWSRNDLKDEISELEKLISDEEDELAGLNEDYSIKQKEADDLSTALPDLENKNKSLINQISKYCSVNTQSQILEFEDIRTSLNSRKEYILDDALFRLRRYEECSQDIADKIETEKVNNPVKYEDVRNELFKENLIKKLDKCNPDSVLYGYIDTIIEMSEKYGIEPELLAAIICKETGWGTSSLCRNANNFGGIRYDDDFGNGKYLAGDGNYYVTYSNPYEGIEAVAQTLADYPGNADGIDAVDLYNINKICNVYAEGSADWQYDVKEFYCGLRWG